MTSTIKYSMTTAALVLVCAVSSCARDAGPPQTATAADSTLYRRLGGYDAIAAVTDSFLARITTDTALNIFFAGLEPPHMNRIRQMVVDQLCAASGGPCLYVGKSMKETHATLDITEQVFQRFVEHMQTTLDAFGVKERERNEVLGALQSMKPDVVTK